MQGSSLFNFFMYWYSVGHYPNTALFNNPPPKIPWQGSGLSSLGRIMLNSQGCVVVVVVYPCFCPKGGKFSQRAAQ
jgi:hypothetical protein